MREKSSHMHTYIALGLGLAIVLMTGLVFFDGYTSVHAASDSEASAVEVMSEIIDSSTSPDMFGFLSNRTQWDFDTDDSYQRFLTNDRPFHDLNYVPADLASIESNFTANDARHFKLRKVAGDIFADMAWHFRDDFKGDKLYILSAYRSKSYQDGLIKKWCAVNACAKWWSSEHQAWLALDLRVMTKWGKLISLDYPNKYTDWLHAHAQEWGFHNTYQKGVAIDGKIVEWWHRRYMGVELATLLWEKWQTIAEYYKWMADNW